MARERGQNVIVLMGDEGTPGTAASGNYRRLPVYSIDLGGGQSLQEDRVLSAGYGREESDPTLDLLDISGKVEVPLDVRNFGYWLKMVFGAPVTTGSGPYTHTFSGGGTLPSRSIETQFPNASTTAKYALATGVKANALDLSWQQGPQQAVRATLDLVGMGHAYASTTAGGTPTTQAYAAYLQATGGISSGAGSTANLMSATLKYSNGLEVVRPVNSGALPIGVDDGAANIAGQIVLRLDDPTLMTNAISRVPVSLSMGWNYSANYGLTIALARCFLSRPKIGVRGPGGIDVTFDYRAVTSGTPGDSISAVLKSPLATY
jgi:hypothetical protein